jgi:hypothetical protein
MDKENLFEFSENDKMVMPKNVAVVIKGLLKQGEISPQIEEIYEIIREEMPTYRHADNSNARKILTRKSIKNIIRKMPITAYLRIIQVLGIASGKFLPGKQEEIF